ncbi:hypothetical protein [Klebsiella pneumoniae IS43]|uniref:Uncharacterized protein n=1 Tax=Klebsiella pneumoniae IS43 TaxID=1432552 RepID=W1DPR8_KLEPN|nr:hypothetical protein [Klebsiella pneumoniae IS43]
MFICNNKVRIYRILKNCATDEGYDLSGKNTGINMTEGWQDHIN